MPCGTVTTIEQLNTALAKAPVFRCTWCVDGRRLSFLTCLAEGGESAVPSHIEAKPLTKGDLRW